MNKKDKLSLKAKLLFNKLDNCVKIISNVNEDKDKKKKQLNVIFSTYNIVINPFIQDESKEYNYDLRKKIIERQEYIENLIDSNSSLDSVLFEITSIMTHLKKIVSTCKVNMDEMNNLWKI